MLDDSVESVLPVHDFKTDRRKPRSDASAHLGTNIRNCRSCKQSLTNSNKHVGPKMQMRGKIDKADCPVHSFCTMAENLFPMSEPLSGRRQQRFNNLKSKSGMQ
jgi:hypothetical protein